MDGNRDERISLRFGRREGGRLALALFVSLCLHLGVWSGYEANKKYDWWDRLADLRPEPKISQRQKAPSAPTALATPVNPSEPMILVEVSQADYEPPPKTKYYSSKSSRAANPDASDASQPKLNGQQRQMPKTEDVALRSKIQPETPPPQPAPEEKTDDEVPPAPETVAAAAAGLGHPGQPGTALTPTPVAPSAPPAHERPRTVQQALQQQSLPGRQMQQEGGVRRQRSIPSFDVKGTPFGEYDHAIVVAVTQRWYDLLDSHRFAQDRTGEVVLQFRLKSDGTIMNMRRNENTVGEMLGYVCQEAIEESAPFAKWPPDMMKEIGANYREITFSFYYN
jgi:uncharacterized iron-regulated membrane protein